MSADDSGGRRKWFGGRAKPTKPTWTGPAPIAARVSFRSQVSQVRTPSSEVGPEPVFVPVTGCSVLVELAASGEHPVSVTAMRAQITSRAAITFDGTARTTPRMPDMIGSDDLTESLRESVANYRPLDPPHLEVLLDGKAPVVRHAEGTTQPALRFPIMLRPGETVSILVAPVTGDPGLTSWNLLLDWEVTGIQNTIPWPLTVTASTGMTTFHPGGTSEPTPVDRVAPDHWVPGRPPGDGRSDDAFTVAAHGGPEGIRVDHCWGDEARYVAARRANDVNGLLDELVGMRVHVPLARSRDPLATVRDGQTFVLVYTSLSRLRELDDDMVDPDNVLTLPFIDVIRDRDESQAGVMVDPFTGLAVNLPPQHMAGLRERYTKVLGRRMEERGG